MSKILYILGEPGSGKTTLVAKLTQGLPSTVQSVPYVSWTEYTEDICQIGHARETFGGTDALSMAAQKHVIEWLKGCPYKYVIAEGDRLANLKFFAAVREQGHQLEVVVLQPPEDVLTKRRKRRSKELGKSQDERWLKTRRTKVSNLVAEANMVLDSTELSVLRTQMATTAVGKALSRARRRARAT